MITKMKKLLWWKYMVQKYIWQQIQYKIPHTEWWFAYNNKYESKYDRKYDMELIQQQNWYKI